MDTQGIHLRVVTISQRQYFSELEEDIVKGKTRITGEGGRLFYTTYVLEDSDVLPWGYVLPIHHCILIITLVICCYWSYSYPLGQLRWKKDWGTTLGLCLAQFLKITSNKEKNQTYSVWLEEEWWITKQRWKGKRTTLMQNNLWTLAMSQSVEYGKLAIRISWDII